MLFLLLIFAAGGTLSLGVVFWILMLLWLVGGFWLYWAPPNYRPIGGHLFLWFLLFLIGWEIFGFPLAK